MLQTAAAFDKLCANGDNFIKRLFVDGVQYNVKMPNRNNLNRCDCFKIPADSGVITVEAVNRKGDYGIQACDTADSVLYDSWRCRPARKDNNDWWKPSSKHRYWKESKGHKCLKHCHTSYFKKPCPMFRELCYWANMARKRNRVRCVVKSKTKYFCVLLILVLKRNAIFA